MRWKTRFIFSFAAGQAENGHYKAVRDFVATIRAELPASVEKSGMWGSRTNVMLKPAAGRILFVRPIVKLPRRSRPIAGWTKNTALHTAFTVWVRRCAIAPQVPASPT